RERRPSPDARPGHPPAHTRTVIAYTITRDAISFATSGTPVNGFDHRWEWSWYDGAAASFITPPEFD
ncbi:hypothetical protein ABZV24_43235, partial [Streptomyces sp. NPDC005251]|uniref:hypothetical protein n=1 Tax=Streptomyces sp. NPDC005251 TaxID=3157166 RepID=UPI0033AE9448